MALWRKWITFVRRMGNVRISSVSVPLEYVLQFFPVVSDAAASDAHYKVWTATCG